MFGIDDALIGAGIGAIGNVVGGAISSSGQSAANWAQMQFASNEARYNRDFQERMSNTAYQRAMGDMRAAGLNPILAYQQGGASQPSGSQATSSVENAMEGLGQGVSSASQLARNAADLQQVKTQTATTASQADLNKASTALNAAGAIKTAQETATSAADERLKAANTALTVEQMDNPKAYRALMGAQAGSAAANARLTTRQAEDAEKWGTSTLGTNAGGAERIVRRLFGAVGNVPPPEPGHSAKGNSTQPKTLRELRPEWFK